MHHTHHIKISLRMPGKDRFSGSSPGVASMVRGTSICFAVLILLSVLSFSQSSDQSGASGDVKPLDAKEGVKADPKDENDAFRGPAIRDVNAIGHRNVGCNRGLANWYTLDKQVAMGRQFARQVDETSRLITDPRIVEYVNRIGQNLARNSDSQLPFTIKVLIDDSPNAFTLPGGFMYVNTGAILAAADESELAGVMAHEIGHVAACHVARESTRGNLMNLASIPLVVFGGPLAGNALQLAAPATFMKFSRNFEAQADYLGIQYAWKAGYDPLGMISFFERIETMEKKKKGFIARAYESHPQTPGRVQKSQQEIATILPAREEYLADTSDFQDIKGQLAILMNRRKMQESQEVQPTLRRVGNPSPDDKSPQDDDRPTLKRHAVAVAR